MKSIFSDEFMSKISLSNYFKNSFQFNNTMIDILENNTDQIIYSKSSEDLYMDYKFKNDFSLILKSIVSKISIGNKERTYTYTYIPIFLNINNNLRKNNDYNFVKLNNLIKKLENIDNNFEVKEGLIIKNEIMEYFIEDIKNNYISKGIELIFNNYENIINKINLDLN